MHKIIKQLINLYSKNQVKDRMHIDSKYSSNITTQSYGTKPRIEGLQYLELPWHSDDGGNFTEIFRVKENQLEGLAEPFTVKQVSMSVLVPGTIKAYHLHFKQDDLWYVPPFQRLLVNLHDVREGSATFDVHQKMVLGAGKNALLRIPKGVAHGIANVYAENMFMCYATNEQFNPADPDEHRLPWDMFGSEVWEVTKG